MKNIALNRLLYNTVTYVTGKLNRPNPFRQRKINKLIGQADASQEDAKQLSTIVTNNLSHLETHSKDRYPTLGSPGDHPTETMIKIIIAVFLNLQTRHLIGVQAIDGPVGLVYQLTTKEKEDESDQDQIRNITLEIIKHTVESRTRKLRAVWSLEPAQELKTHDVDLEQELIKAIAFEVARDITTEHITTIKTLAEHNHVQQIESADDDRLEVEINKQGNMIAKDTRRGSANWIVAPESSRLVTKYAVDNNKTPADDIISYVGVTKTGLDLYSAPELVLDPDTILIGYKGKYQFDAGLFYNPYVLLFGGGVEVDPYTFEPKETLMTRYGLCEGNLAKNYYRVIELK